MKQFEEKEIELIKKVKELLKNNKSKEEYSIFDVEEVGQKEVIMCRVLADFLDPNGKHHQGNIYLENFYNLLNEKQDSIKYFCSTEDEIQIIKEQTIESNKNTKKRIDIVINNKSNKKLYLPIEVKINAYEQENEKEDYKQCQFYLERAKKMYTQEENARLVFLTKDGREPKTINIDDDKNKIICLSWEEDIIKWIDKSIDKTEDLAIKSILKQFKLTIQRFTYNMQDKEFEFIKDNVIKNMANANGIKQKIDEYKNKFKEDIENIIFDISKKEKFNKNNEIIFDNNNGLITKYIGKKTKNEGFVFGKLEDGYGFGIQLKTSCKENEKRNELLFEILSNFDYDTQEDWGIWINKINFYDYNYEIKVNNYEYNFKFKKILEYIKEINDKINELKINSEKITEVKTDLSNKDILFYADKIAKVVIILSKNIWLNLVNKIYENLKNSVPADIIINTNNIEWCLTCSRDNKKIILYADHKKNVRNGSVVLKIDKSDDTFSLADVIENIDKYSTDISNKIIKELNKKNN